MTASVAMDRRFACLNGLRALAATAVITTHVGFQTGTTVRGGATGAVLSRLDFGVALFFVLSGFLLARPYVLTAATGTARPATGVYLWRRALRILPTYWLAVVAAFVLVQGNSALPAGTWLRQLTLTQIYRHDLARVPALTQMWSLCVEVAFYLVLPGLARLITHRLCGGGWYPRRLLAAAGAMILVAPAWLVAIRLADQSTAAMLNAWLPAYLSWFGAGLALAVLSVACETRRWPPAVRLDRLARETGTWWLGAAALFIVASTPVAGPRLLDFPSAGAAVTKNLLYAAAATCLVLPLVLGGSGGTIRRVLSHRTANYFGELSYAMFCIHLIVIELVYSGLDTGPFHGRFGTVWLLTVLGTLALSAAVYRWLESPLRRFRNPPRTWRIGRAAGSAASAATVAPSETSAAS